MLKQHAEHTPPYRGLGQALGGLVVVALLVLCASVAFSPGTAALLPPFGAARPYVADAGSRPASALMVC